MGFHRNLGQILVSPENISVSTARGDLSTAEGTRKAAACVVPTKLGNRNPRDPAEGRRAPVYGTAGGKDVWNIESS